MSGLIIVQSYFGIALELIERRVEGMTDHRWNVEEKALIHRIDSM